MNERESILELCLDKGLKIDDRCQRLCLSPWRLPEQLGDVAAIVQTHGPSPRGLWYGFGREWLRRVACHGSGSMTSALYLYELTIVHTHFFQVTSYDLRQHLERTYGRDAVPAELPVFDSILNIDWPTVSAKASGIEVHPYWPPQIGETGWYRMWGFGGSAGCLWRRDGFGGAKLLASRATHTSPFKLETKARLPRK